jgi:hypothetical protein
VSDLLQSPKFICCVLAFLIVKAGLVYAKNDIPDNISEWTNQGAVSITPSSATWESIFGDIISVEKVGNIYYMYYLAGFKGNWDEGASHQSIGLATSTDGLHFTRDARNPVLRPHDFDPQIYSHEEGIRTAFIKWVPELSKFVAYIGLDYDPESRTGCDYMEAGCPGDIEVDAKIYAAESVNGTNWNVLGPVSGTLATPGKETYAASFVYVNGKFYLWITEAQDGYCHRLSSGSSITSLTEIGIVSGLNFGWAKVVAYLNSDKTVSLIYSPRGGSHPGADTGKQYMADVNLASPLSISNERVIQQRGDFSMALTKDDSTWRWYYFPYNSVSLNLRTHKIDETGEALLPPGKPAELRLID